MKTQIEVVTITLSSHELASLIANAVEKAIKPLRERIDTLQREEKEVSLAVAAKQMGVSVQTLRSYISEGRLHPHHRKPVKLAATVTKGGHYRINTSALREYVALFRTQNPCALK